MRGMMTDDDRPMTVLAPAHPIVFGGSAEALRRDLDASFASGHCQVAVNLAAVPYIDSEGVRALVHGHNLAAARGGSFILVAPSPRVRQLLWTTHLNTVLEIHDSFDVIAPKPVDGSR
jgi:anti-anti-sigma factor